LEEQESAHRALEAAAREDRLDFATAAKILMTTPAKERKFGWDFHLVQFFFACLPPLGNQTLFSKPCCCHYTRDDKAFVTCKSTIISIFLA
jgi:hypothetical protein